MTEMGRMSRLKTIIIIIIIIIIPLLLIIIDGTVLVHKPK